MTPILDRFVENYSELKKLLLTNNELTMLTSVETHFKKTFLLSCASFHETKVNGFLKDFLYSQSNDSKVSSFAINKGVNRQYHTYFNWDGRNINSFLGLFGNDFKETVNREINESDELRNCMIAFLVIGDTRNKMVHENFLEYNLEKTFDEIVELNKQAIRFIEFLNEKFVLNISTPKPDKV